MKPTRVVAVTTALACLTGALSLAQAPRPQGAPPPAAKGAGVVSGQVVDAANGRGIPGALVTIMPPQPAAAPVGELTEARPPSIPFVGVTGSQRVLSGADGRFLFRDLPRGSFTILATSPLHLLGQYGQLRPEGPGLLIDVADAQTHAPIVIRLWRNGTITGIVRDEHGEPAVSVGVECYRKVVAGGQRRFASPATTSTLLTDDRGVYRAGNIPPGEYICGVSPNPVTMPVAVTQAIEEADAAAGRAGGSAAARRLTDSGGLSTASGMRIGDFTYSSGAATTRGPMPPPPDAGGRLLAYAPVYYPGVPTTSRATLISVAPGQERAGIDLQLQLVPSVKVQGTIVGPDGPAPLVGVRLVPTSGNDLASEGQAEFARTSTDPAGAFTFLGVPAGEYIIKSRIFPRPAAGGLQAAIDAEALWIATPLTVGDRDVTGLSIPLRSGIRARGRVVFEGTRQPPAPAQWQAIQIRLQQAEGRTSSPTALPGIVDATGAFKTSGYPAGKYIVNVTPNTVPAGWRVRSIELNGRDYSVEPLELSADDVTGLVVTFTDKMTALAGTVTGPKGPDLTAEVVVFPADSMAWRQIGVVARRHRVARVDARGGFAFDALPPGEYFVAAIAGDREGDRSDPAWLAALMGGATRVSIADGASVTVALAVKR